MAERIEEPETEVQEPLAQASPAVGIAMGRTSRTESGAKAVDAEAATFLRDQRRLINLQSEHLHEQRALQLAHLRVRRWKDRLALALQALTVAIGVAVVIGFVMLAWRAHEDHGLVVEPFSAPPSFVQRGVGGEVVAADIVDKLSAIVAVARAHSFSSTSGVSADTSKEVKIEIPETGLSLGEVWRLMRDALGSERKVTGAVRETGDGRIELTARLGGQAFTVTGAPAELGQLEQQIAEQLYAATDPVNIVIYLEFQGRKSEALAAAARNAATAHGRLERADAFALWAESDDPLRELRLARIALGIDPGLLVGRFDVVLAERQLGHEEAALAEARRMLASEDVDQPPQHRGEGAAKLRAFARLVIEDQTGDFTAAARDEARDASSDAPTARRLVVQAVNAARRHDPAASTAMLAEAVASGPPNPYRLLEARYDTDAVREDWPAALADAQALTAAADKAFSASTDEDKKAGLAVDSRTRYRPRLAEGLAHTGDLAGAATLITTTPTDCYDCLRRRGRIAALAGDPVGAQRWFGEAIRQGPSLPFAYADWGEMLLARGQVDAAIAKLSVAHAKGPKFADPLELWGEALLRKRDFAGAAQKFAEAARYAPAWDRNRLLWRKALQQRAD